MRSRYIFLFVGALLTLCLFSVAGVAATTTPEGTIWVASEPSGTQPGTFHTLSADGTSPDELPGYSTTGVYEMLAVSPDASRVGFLERVPNTEPVGETFRNELWTANVDGTDRQRILDTTDRSVRQVVWSPRGDWIAVAYTTWPGSNGNTSRNAVAVVRPDGSEIRPVDLGVSAGRTLSFTPDGNRLLYDEGSTSTGCQLHLFDIATQVRTPLSCTGQPLEARFSQDGSRLSYVTPHGQGGNRLWIADADGSDPQPLFDGQIFPPPEGELENPYAIVRNEIGYPFSDDGNWILIIRKDLRTFSDGLALHFRTRTAR